MAQYVDGKTHSQAFCKRLKHTTTADEMLDLLIDCLALTTEGLATPFPFGSAWCISLPNDRDWIYDVLHNLVVHARDRRRGKARALPVPILPQVGTFWHGPDDRILNVMCRTQSGIVFCAKVEDDPLRLDYGRLVAYAIDDFKTFRPYGEPKDAGDAAAESQTLGSGP